MKNFILVLICPLFLSCSSPNNYFFVEVKTYQSFLIEDELSSRDIYPLPESVIGINGILVIDSMLIISKNNQTTNLSIVNLKNNKISENVCFTGRGPNEYLSFITFGQYIKESEKIYLYTFDYNDYSVKVLNVTESWLKNETIIEGTRDIKNIYNFFLQGLLFFNDNDIFVKYRTSYVDIRDLIFNPAEYVIFHNREKKEIINFFGTDVASNSSLPMLSDQLYCGICKIKPDGSQIVDGIIFMDYINFIDLKKKNAYGLKYKNSISYEEIRNMSIDELMQKHKYAYADISVTNDYVFGLYWGYGDFTPTQELIENQCIRIFNWNGTPLASLKINHQKMINITFDERTNLLYALDTEDRIFIYDISKVIEKIRHEV